VRPSRDGICLAFVRGKKINSSNTITAIVRAKGINVNFLCAMDFDYNIIPPGPTIQHTFWTKTVDFLAKIR
jgi:hypothetical protein